MSEKVKEEGSFKVKKKPGRPRKLVSQDETFKVDLNKKEEDVVEEKEKTTEPVVNEKSEGTIKQEGNTEPEQPTESSENKEEQEKDVTPVIEEIIEEEETKEPVIEQTTEPITEQRQLPENIEKLVKFMEDTGGTVEDYVRINADYSNLDNNKLLEEYYRQTRPHLDYEEVKFLMEDNFKYDEEVDEEREIRKKKLVYKEEIAKAKNFLEETKKKYYDEIKLRPGVTQEQQKATDFFNRYNEEQKMVKEQHGRFKQRTDNFFNKEFKGFNFDVGEKKFRFKVANTTNVAKNQSDLTNLVGKFLDNKGEVKDYAGYHKAIYAAENADTIASHFYEQGKSDAIKEMTAKSKNITEDARQTVANAGDVFINGLRVKAISGANSSKLKIKTIKK